MAYTEHVILKGLDEARAHQRGEPVGKPVGKTASPACVILTKRPVEKPVMKEPRSKGRKEYVSVASAIPADVVAYILETEAPAKEIAQQCGLTIQAVSAVLKKHDVTKPRVQYVKKPKRDPLAPKKTRLTNEQRRAIALQEGPLKDIAAEHDLDPVTVRAWRKMLADGTFDMPPPPRKKRKQVESKKHLSDRERRAIAMEEGTAVEVAAKHNVSNVSVANWRHKLAQGLL